MASQSDQAFEKLSARLDLKCKPSEKQLWEKAFGASRGRGGQLSTVIRRLLNDEAHLVLGGMSARV